MLFLLYSFNLLLNYHDLYRMCIFLPPISTIINLCEPIPFSGPRLPFLPTVNWHDPRMSLSSNLLNSCL